MLGVSQVHTCRQGHGLSPWQFPGDKWQISLQILELQSTTPKCPCQVPQTRESSAYLFMRNTVISD